MPKLSPTQPFGICLVRQCSSPLTAAQTWTTFLARFKTITVAVPFLELARAKFSTRDSSNHSMRFIVDSVGCFREVVILMDASGYFCTLKAMDT